jgi:lysophospholipase L1-like esterase
LRVLLLAALLAAAYPAPPATPGTKAKRSRKPAIPKPPPISAEARERLQQEVAQQLIDTTDSLENTRALVPFFEQLYRMSKGERPGPLSILHYGDSHTAADEWTGTLRSLLQGRFGDGGAGFSHAGRPWNTYRRLDVRSYGSTGWHTEGLVGRTGDGMYGLSGVSISTQSAAQSVALQAAGSILQVFYLRQPGGGELELNDNGERVGIMSTGGETGAGYFKQAIQSGEHRLTLRTLDPAPVRLFGWVTGNPSGVTYETLGINGAQASIVLRWDMPVLQSNIAERNPGLIVLAYGTNEASNPDYTQDSYRQMFLEVLARFRTAAPQASILVIGPPDRYVRTRGRWVAYDSVDRIVAAQREAARIAGCSFLDLRGKMGGKGSMRTWVLSGLAQYDYVHLSSAGYHLLGESMFRDLMTQYGIFVKAREQ